MHSTDNMDDGYLGSGIRLNRSVKKHGRENHVRVILEDCSKQGRKFLRKREKEIVDGKLINDFLCMNLMKGGGYGEATMLRISQGQRRRTVSIEEKQRRSLTAIERERKKRVQGYKVSEAAKQKISEAQKGRKRSEKTRQRMSEAAKLRELKKKENGWEYPKAPIETRRRRVAAGEIEHPFSGKKHSLETRKRLSVIAKKQWALRRKVKIQGLGEAA